jgi:dihydropteroate synthase
MNARILNITNENEAVEYLKKTGSDPRSLNILAPKALFKTVWLDKVSNKAANIIKQECLSLGCDAAVNWEISCFKNGTSPVLVMATHKQLSLLIKKLENQPFGLSLIAADIENAVINNEITEFKLGDIKIFPGKPAVMGILNVTPDSFSDGNKYLDLDKAVEHALLMQEEGASIIDIGGESTKPGARRVSLQEELKRVVPVIKNLSKKIKIPISIDTYKSEVALAALDAGASLINDITALRYKNGSMAKLAARKRVPVVLMHMQGNPGTMQKGPKYTDVVSDICDFFAGRIEFAKAQGIKEENIILDPGIGFGKTPKHNLEILKHLKEFTFLGRPLMVGSSMKSFIGNILGGIPADERLSGSLASFVFAALNGAGILRVHNVKETIQALKVVEAINS